MIRWLGLAYWAAMAYAWGGVGVLFGVFFYLGVVWEAFGKPRCPK